MCRQRPHTSCCRLLLAACCENPVLKKIDESPPTRPEQCGCLVNFQAAKSCSSGFESWHLSLSGKARIGLWLRPVVLGAEVLGGGSTRVTPKNSQISKMEGPQKADCQKGSACVKKAHVPKTNLHIRLQSAIPFCNAHCCQAVSAQNMPQQKLHGMTGRPFPTTFAAPLTMAAVT